MTDQLTADGIQDATEPPVEAKVEPSIGEYRYPGVPPFADSEMDRLLFRGRANEIDQVLHSILSFDLFLIYAISGLGKTSLLSAGVMEPLRLRDFFPVLIRLNNPEKSAVELIDEQLREAASKVDGITVMRNPSLADVEGSSSTLWDLLSGLEVWKGNTLQHLVLIFDQFEELFTLGWSNEQRGQFIEQFGQVVRRHRTRPAGSPTDPAALLPPPAVKITLIIREDFLGELEAMAQQVPQIMRHRFRLDGLVQEQAELAVREPAHINDPRLVTPQFSYSEGAAQEILGFLGARQDRGRPALTQTIDPSQLQIICQHIERSILPNKSAPNADGVVEITEEDLGGKAGLDRILRDFYRRELSSFPSSQRKIVRNLCETGLINQRGRRLSLEEEEIGTKYKVSKATLEDLVARRLLRAEPRVGSVYYELAHDTLAAPILAYRDGARSARRRKWLVALSGLVIVALLVGWMGTRSSSDAAEASRPSGQNISIGDVVTGTVTGSSKSYVFDAAENQTVIVAVAPTAADNIGTLMLEVTEPQASVKNNETVQSGDNPGNVLQDSEKVVLPHTVKGRYLVVVSGFDSTAVGFELSVRSADVVKMAVGDSKPGALDSDNSAALFEFEAPDAQSFVVQVTPSPGNSLDAVLRVTGPTGVTQDADNAGANSLAEAQDPSVVDGTDATGGNGAETVLVDGTVQGSYLVVVSGFDSSEGAFQLNVRQADIVPMEVGDTKPGIIDTSSPLGVFAFDTADSQSLIIDLKPRDATDLASLQLQVADPNGTVDEADITGTDELQTALVESTVTGRYVVVVRGLGSSTVGFDLSVRAADVVPLAIGEPASGTNDSANPFGVFTFDAPADTTVVVEVTSNSEDNADFPTLRVTDPTGLIDEADPAAGGNVQQVVVGKTVQGRYTVVVSGFGSPNPFEVSVHPITVVRMAVGQDVAGTIDPDHPAAVFEFEPPSARTFVIELTPDVGLDAVLVASIVDGFVDNSEDYAAEGGIETAIVDGTLADSYQIVVSGFQSTTGGFGLSVHPADVEQVAIGDTVSGTIDTSNPIAVFEFKVSDAQPVSIDATPTDDFRPVLEVIDPTGFMYPPSFDSENGNESVELDAAVRGRYMVVVKSWKSTTGDFQMSIHH